MISSRRTFLALGAAATVASAIGMRRAYGSPLGLPLGIQLYSVRDQMKVNLDEALGAIHDAGYTEVEAAALPAKPAKEIRAALDKAMLRCVSAHHPYAELSSKFDEMLAFDKELGVKFMICSSPGFRNPGARRQISTHHDTRRLEIQRRAVQQVRREDRRFRHHVRIPQPRS